MHTETRVVLRFPLKQQHLNLWQFRRILISLQPEFLDPRNNSANYISPLSLTSIKPEQRSLLPLTVVKLSWQYEFWLSWLRRSHEERRDKRNTGLLEYLDQIFWKSGNDTFKSDFLARMKIFIIAICTLKSGYNIYQNRN